MHPILTRHLNIEAIRLSEVEAAVHGSDAIDAKLAEQSGTFREKLIARTGFLAEFNGIDRITDQIGSRLSAAFLLLCCLFASLGCLAVINAFDSQLDATVNFYWLILVLIGFNLLSMLVWLSMMTFNFSSLFSNQTHASTHQGLLYFLINWFIARTVTSKDKALQASTLRAWTRVYRDSGLATWELSRISHLFWLSYLCGGIIMVLIMLSVREYNFGWATTILTPETFIDVTLALSKLPEMIGLAVPDRDMIAGSRLESVAAAGIAEQPLDYAEVKTRWAILLISALVLYGIVPRVLLLLFCHLKTKQSIAAYDPDYSQPYFLDLQQRLIPVTKNFGIIDPDANAATVIADPGTTVASTHLPAGARYLTLELDPDSRWPLSSIDSEALLGEANDSDSQYQALEAVGKLSDPLVCVVSLMRSPDRGIARFIGELKAQCPTPFYLLVDSSSGSDNSADNDSIADLRLGDWHRVAVQLDISDSHFIYMQNPSKSSPSAQGDQF